MQLIDLNLYMNVYVYVFIYLFNTQSMLITNVDERKKLSVHAANKLYLCALINRVSKPFF